MFLLDRHHLRSPTKSFTTSKTLEVELVMALHLKLKPRAINLTPFRSAVVPFSSSSSSSDVPPPPESNSEGGGTAENDAAPSYSSYFSDIKERLKSHPAPPRRIPLDPPPPPSLSSPAPGAAPASSLDEIRKHLAEFRNRSPSSGDRTPPRPPSQQSTISFQDLLKNNVLNRPSDIGGASPATSLDNDGRLSFEAIRERLRQIPKSTREQSGPRKTLFNLRSFQDSLHPDGTEKTTSILGSDALPDLIFGREKREKEESKGESGNEAKTEFLKTYNYDELGEKLRKLRTDTAAKGDEGFLKELHERLVKLRELEEEEKESGISGVFRDLRESLVKLKDAETNKKSNLRRISIITSLTGKVTPTFMLNPPQEHLLEKYFHPDHISSAEKMKLELKKVRDEFKMSESDCGSARVQVAQLTTKIKHLSSVLHKKDKHSRKGLKEMVQKRKKLLKYLRRTDWVSYCLVLSRFGLRDVPEYRAPDYKT